MGVHLVVDLGVCNNFNTLDPLPMHRFFCALIVTCAGNIEWHAHNGLVHTCYALGSVVVFKPDKWQTKCVGLDCYKEAMA